MTYPRRIAIAAVGSAFVHLVLLSVWIAAPEPKTVDAAYRRAPLILNLQPPPKQEVRQLIDVLHPTEEPVAETNLISDANSKAADQQTHPGEEPGPRLDQTDTQDALDLEPGESPEQNTPETPPEETIPQEKTQPSKPEIAPNVSQTQAPETEPEPSTRSTPDSFALLPSIPPPPPQNLDPTTALNAELEPQQDDPLAENVPPIQIAKAVPGKGIDPTRSVAKGRARDLITHKGFTSFEALQDELAPYLMNIRQRVERKWNEMLLRRYSGTRQTSAVIDCAIDATGKVVSVVVVGEPGNRVFAALCKSIIEEAGPFGPFPFDVPNIYRSKNLEIRWTFNFL